MGRILTEITEAVNWIREADAVLISASNGLSIAEGYHIFADNDDFKNYFGYYRERYGIDCLIRGVFADIPEHGRYMQTVHRYMIEDYSGSLVMQNLMRIVGNKDYFIVTSNCDTHFQMNGFAEERIFEVEGNFDGLIMRSPAWESEQQRFQDFVEQGGLKTVIVFELGIGMRNTMIKKPLMDMVRDHPSWRYITLNMPQEIYVPDGIKDRSIAISGDIAETFELMVKEVEKDK